MAFLAREHYSDSYYEHHARRYLRRSRFTRQRLANVFELAGDVAGRRVLDLGCGIGTFAVECARRNAFALGLDPALPALAVARGLVRRLRVGTAGLVAADAARIPTPSASFDVVICADLTEHLDDATLREVLADVRRVLRPGGVLALYTPSPTHLFERLKRRGWLIRHDPSHIGLRSMQRLVAELETAGLQVDRAYHRPTHLPGYRLAEQALERVPGLGGLFRRRICIAATRPAPSVAGATTDEA